SGYAPTAGPAPADGFAWLPATDLPARLVCYLNRLDEIAEFVVWADVRRLPTARLELLVRGVEKLLVAAATRDVDLTELPALTGLSPVDRGADWCFGDCGWVDLAEVRRL